MANTAITKQNYNVSFVMGAYNETKLKELAQGSIAITTDEQALYVKTTNDTTKMPIRIGQIVTYATFSAFETAINGTNPPYSTEGFYYIADQNALLKYVVDGGDYPSSGDHKGTWKQINKPTDIGDLSTTVSSLTSGLAAANSAIEANTKNIEANTDNISKNKAAIEKNTADILSEVTALSNTVNGKVNTSDYTTAINDINEKINKKVEQSDYNAKITALEKVDADLTGTVNDLIKKVDNTDNIMNFRGGVTADEVTDISKKITDPQPGDVVVVTSGKLSGSEYVYIETKEATDTGAAEYDWEQIGYAEHVTAEVASLQGQITALSNTVNTKADNSALTAGLATKVDTSAYTAQVNDFEERISKNASDITETNNKITTEINNALAWGIF